MATPRRRRNAITVQAASVSNLLAATKFYPSFLLKELKGELGQGLDRYKTTMQKRSTSGPLQKRSGRLGNSWVVTVGGSRLSGVSGIIGSLATYSRIHELGETVRPKNPQGWIFIPTKFNMRANGRALKTPRQVISQGGRFMTVRVYRLTEENAEFFLNQMDFISNDLLISGGGFSEPAFTLVKSAQYAAVLKFFKTGEAFESQLSGDLGRDLTDFWKEVNF